MSNLFSARLGAKSKIVVVLLLIVSLVCLSSVNAASKNTTGIKPPKAKDAQVSIDDITSLNDYASTHSDARLVTDANELNRIKTSVTSNKELQKFSGLNKNSLSDAFKHAAYSGKSQNKYDVYTTDIEYTTKSGDKVFLLVTYDMDRNMMLESLNYTETPDQQITIVSRNMGLTFIGDRAEAERIINAKTPEEKRALKEKNKEKHKGEIKKSAKGSSNFVNAIASAFSIDKTSANTCSGSLNLSSSQCSWVSIPICVAAGLFAFLPGLICTIGYNYICNYTC